MAPPPATESTINLIEDYYARKVDVISQLEPDNEPTQQLETLNIDNEKGQKTPPDTPKKEQQEQS